MIKEDITNLRYIIVNSARPRGMIFNLNKVARTGALYFEMKLWIISVGPLVPPPPDFASRTLYREVFVVILVVLTLN